MGLKEKETDYYLNVVSKHFLIDDFTGKGAIEEYYKDAVWAYRLFHSRQGAIHMAINPDGQYHPDGYLIQAEKVGEYLSSGMKVLELGAGIGFNSLCLARSHPGVSFLASDFSQDQVKRMTKKFKGIQNIKAKKIDYRNIEEPADSFDVIFMVETLCYSTDNKRDLKEISRVLKPEGKIIIFDGWATDLAKSPPWQEASDWARASMALESSWNLEEFKKVAKREFRIEKEEDFSKDILPCLLRLHRLAWRFFRRPRLVSLIKRILPRVSQNSVAGILMPNLFSSGAWSYRMIVLEKTTTER